MDKHVINKIVLGIIGFFLVLFVPNHAYAANCTWQVNGGNIQFCVSGLTSPAAIPQMTLTCTNQYCPYVGSSNFTMQPPKAATLGAKTFTSCTTLDDTTKEKISRQVNLDYNACKGGPTPNSCNDVYTREQPQITGAVAGLCSSSISVQTSLGLVVTVPGSNGGSTNPVFTDTNPPKTDNGSGGGGTPGKVTDPTCAVPGGDTGINTAIGCIDVSSTDVIFKTVLGLFIGVAGGIAFLIILLGGLKVMMSAGNPKAVAEGQEIITSAVVGLLLIIFSLFLLRVIGVDVLGLPGFG